MTLDELLGMSRADKIMILAACDVFSMLRMDDKPGIRFSRVGISLAGRKGLLDYSEGDLDSEIEDYAEDLSNLGGSVDELIAWAQETTGVQYVDPENRDWKYRPGMVGAGIDQPRVDGPPTRPRGIFGELVDELEGIRDSSSEEEGFIYVNGRIDVRLLGRIE